MIDISGTQFISPTPIAPISSEPRRTACAVSRSLPICAFGKICTCILPPLLSSRVFLNCSAQRCQPCAVGAGCARRMRLTPACAAATPETKGDKAATAAEAPAKRRMSLRVAVPATRFAVRRPNRKHCDESMTFLLIRIDDQYLKLSQLGSTVVIAGTNVTSKSPANRTGRYQRSGLLARSICAPLIAQAT